MCKLIWFLELKRIIRRQERHILKLEDDRLTQRQSQRRWRKIYAWLVALVAIYIMVIVAPTHLANNDTSIAI